MATKRVKQKVREVEMTYWRTVMAKKQLCVATKRAKTKYGGRHFMIIQREVLYCLKRGWVALEHIFRK